MLTLDKLNAALAGRYLVDREVGAGGMATVFLARDVKHNRRVALKVLKPELGIVLGPERFLSEIETTANLQHPHLLPLFDSGSVPAGHLDPNHPDPDGEGPSLLFYVMPYVEGETLRQRIERERQLPVDEAIRIAVSVASALDYAHRHGVIHRDLKPENILLHEGQPLVTDFGIALAVSNAGGARITQTGLSLGTPQYMSPEQATGDRVLDARSDIYSLGAVLYETLAGDPPHSAGTTQAIIAKVLTEKPPSVRALRDTVPEYVDLAIQKALAKLAADRFASAGEFAEALTGERRVTAIPKAIGSADAPVAAAVATRSRRTAIPLWGGWVVGAVGIAIAAVALLRQVPPAQTARFMVSFPDSVELGAGASTNVLLSPDGSKLVFVGRRGGTAGLFLRRLDDPTPQLIRGSEGGLTPALSPDASWVAFRRGEGLFKVPVTGGAPLTIADSVYPGFSWGDRNEIVFRDGAFALWRVSADGGPRTLLATPDSTHNHVRYNTPNVLPGGRAVLITIAKGSRGLAGSQLFATELGVVTIPDGKVTELGVPGSYPRYIQQGYVLFGRPDGSVMAAPFSLRQLRLTGPPVPVLEGVANFTNGVTAIAVAQNGTLAYIATYSAEKRSMVAVDRKGVARPFSTEREPDEFPRISPDGRRVALSVHVPGTPSTDIWVYDVPSRTLTRLTHDGTSSRSEWTPDGRRIAYLARDSAGGVVKWQAWDGSGAAEVMVRPKPGVAEVSFGPAHGYAAFRVVNSVGGASDRDIWIAPLDSIDAVRPFIATPVWEGNPRVSPNGRLLAYVSEETGRAEVFVRPLPGPGGRVQVSSGGGDEPLWSPDGREIFYRGPTQFMAASIAERPELAVTRRDSLFEDVYVRLGDHPNYDVFPNGREFLMLGQERSESKLYVVVNWTEELKRRLRAK